MKVILLIGFAYFFAPLFSQSIEFTHFEVRENLPDWVMTKIDFIQTSKNLIIDDTLNPFYLECDFNGDKVLDIALFVTDKDSNKKGILIIHGKSLKTFLIGAGDSFCNKSDNFNWLKVWKLYRNNTAYETTFTENMDIEGSKPVKLFYVAIQVAQSEETPNLIVWDGNKYTWIHTGE
jgi:hypothetical protein